MTIHRHLLYGFAAWTVCYAGAGYALGLGGLTLQSALHQPLQATIQLHDSENLRPSDVVVSLADADTFARMGMVRPLFLTGLRFTPVMDNRQLVIRVESSNPVREPYLSFVVQLKRANGNLLREYTLLLDPPLYQPAPIMASSLGVAADTAPWSASANAVPTPSAAASGTTVSAPARRSAVRPQPGAGRYQTLAGDSLWTIAVATRVGESVSIRRQMDDIVALNPHAFVNGDPARLRLGQELILPAAGPAAAVPAAASRESAAQLALPQPQEPEEIAPGSDRLRLEEPQQPMNEEQQQFMERLVVAENRLRRLLGELELRDAQIAELEVQLESLRQANAAALLAGVSEQSIGQASEPVPEIIVAPSAVDQPAVATIGGLEGDTGASDPAELRGGWLARWWPAPVALLAALFGALLLRSRRNSGEAEKTEETGLAQLLATPTAQPLTIPGSRVVDPLEGVELYLAYGRLPEAKVMLDKAIADEPQRLDLHMRLLSVLAELGDLQGFARQEQELTRLGAGQAQIDRVKAHHPDLFGLAGRTEPSL